MTAPITFTIRAFAASKANNRKIVETPTGQLRVIKSASARAFATNCKQQCPKRADLPFTVPVMAIIRIYYPDQRADLDESALLDALQSYSRMEGKPKRRVIHWPGLWLNDRLVRTRFADHAIDAADPRIEMHVEERPQVFMALSWNRDYPHTGAATMYPQSGLLIVSE